MTANGGLGGRTGRLGEEDRLNPHPLLRGAKSAAPGKATATATAIEAGPSLRFGMTTKIERRKGNRKGNATALAFAECAKVGPPGRRVRIYFLNFCNTAGTK